MIISNILFLFCMSSCSIWEKKEEIKINKIQEKKVIKKISTLDKLKKLDFQTDNSITKYIDNKISYNNKKYIPKNLVNLKWDFIIDTKWNQKIRKITLKNLDKLSKDFYNTFWKKLRVVSAYRSYIYQKWIKDRGCPDNLCANAGYSEHQSGLAFDLWEASTKERFEKNQKLKIYFDWMKQNAFKYWFENSYQNWKKIDWYAIEPWHWRYVWNNLAKYLHKNKLTFAQFYYNNIKK